MNVLVYMTAQYVADSKRVVTKKQKDHRDKEKQRSGFYIDYLKCVNTDGHELYLYTTGHDKTWPWKTVERELDERFMIHYVLKGTVQFNDTTIHAGQYFFILPQQKHLLKFTDPELEMYYMTLKGTGLMRMIKTYGFDRIKQVNDCPFIDKIIPLFEKMIYECPDYGDLFAYTTGLMYQVLSYQYYHCSKELLLEEQKHDAGDRYISQAMDLISQRYTQDINVAMLAEKMHITPGYLGNLFRQKLGTSPMAVIMQKRMELAKILLETSNQPKLANIALICGYNNYTYFCRCFTQYYGMSPKAFSEEFRQKNMSKDQRGEKKV